MKKQKAVLFTAIFIVVSVFFYQKTEEQKATIKPSRTEAEIKNFWEVEVAPTINSLVESKTQYAEVNARFTDSNNEVFKKTHKVLAVNLSTAYHWATKDAEASAGFDFNNGSVSIEIYVQSIMDTFEVMRERSEPLWREAFCAHIIIVFMHEMEHARGDIDQIKHIDINEEFRAWKETCRYTIAPLADKYHIPLTLNDFKVYMAWKESDVNNQVWINAIRHLYADFDGRTK